MFRLTSVYCSVTLVRRIISVFSIRFTAEAITGRIRYYCPEPGATTFTPQPTLNRCADVLPFDSGSPSEVTTNVLPKRIGKIDSSKKVGDSSHFFGVSPTSLEALLYSLVLHKSFSAFGVFSVWLRKSPTNSSNSRWRTDTLPDVSGRGDPHMH